MKLDDLFTLLLLFVSGVAIAKWPRFWRTLRYPNSSNWPLLPGTVEQAVVRSCSGRNGTSYRAEICYSYRVNDDYYSGYYLGDLYSSEAEIDSIVQQFPKGTNVQIHVHPKKPELSVLGA